MDEKRTLVVINQYQNFNNQEYQKLLAAKSAIETIVNHRLFREEVLAAEFGETNGKSNEQILQMILEGTEILSPEQDYEIDVSIIVYYSFKKVVGYTYASTPITWINRKFLFSFKGLKFASNMMHEYMHKLGFGHDFWPTKRRPFSVPYQMNRIIEKVGAQLGIL
jgi:hypothetical protein